MGGTLLRQTSSDSPLWVRPLMEVEISSLLPEDVEGVAAVHVQAWQAAYPGMMADEFLGNLSADVAADYWSHVAWRRDGNAFVARRDGQHRRIHRRRRTPESGRRASASCTDSTSHPNTGAPASGTQLLHRAERRLHQLGFTDVVLYVASENARGRRFYEREGWTDDGVDEVEEFGGRPVEERRYSRRALSRQSASPYSRGIDFALSLIPDEPLLPGDEFHDLLARSGPTTGWRR